MTEKLQDSLTKIYFRLSRGDNFEKVKLDHKTVFLLKVYYSMIF